MSLLPLQLPEAREARLERRSNEILTARSDNQLSHRVWLPRSYFSPLPQWNPGGGSAHSTAGRVARNAITNSQR
jgi:hypothetical protein